MATMFSQPDHPLANAAEVDGLLRELPMQEPSAALDNAAAWIESLVATDEFKPERRLDLVMRIDEAVLPHARRLAREYVSVPDMARATEFRHWQRNQAYWRTLAAAYEDSLRRFREGGRAADALGPLLSLLSARLLHACGNWLKWTHFRYGPLPGVLWQKAGGVYLAAEGLQAATRPVIMYPDSRETTPAAEYLRVLLIRASSLDNLLPMGMEIAERLISHLLPSFSLTDQARPDNVYWVDAAKPLPPTRLASLPDVTPTLRFFATASALGSLQQLRLEIASRGALPPEVNFGCQYPVKVVLPVIDHLAACWAPVPPMRHHVRHRVQSRMTVVGSLAEIRHQLAGQSQGGETTDSWEIEDVSQGGIGAQASLVGKEWLKVGCLVGLQPEGGDNWLVGVVRRLVRESDIAGSVGIETLSKQPKGAIALGDGLETEIVLLDPVQGGGEVRLALSMVAWEGQAPLMADIDGRRFRLFPQDELDTGAGHVVGTYRAEESES